MDGVHGAFGMTTAGQFDFTVAAADGRAEVHLVGDLDISTAPLLREGLLGVLAEGTNDVTLDMSRLSFIDSTGLSVLVGAYKRARHDGRAMVLRNPRPSARKVLEISGLDTVIPIT